MSQEITTSSNSEELQRLRQQLAEVKDQLESLQNRKSSMLAMAVHDLRTPLAIIQGYSQLLAADLTEESDPTHEYISNIVTHADSLARMIENLVILDRLDRGQYRLSAIKTDLHERVGQAVAQVEGLTLLKGLTISNQASSGSIQVFADEDQIDRILYNLLSHVIKYARPGSELRIDVERHDRYGQVAILDPNRRLSEATLKRLFYFVGTNEDKSTSLQGTDMGLVLARLVAEEHGGRLEAIDDPRYGLTLALFLPVV